MYLCKKIFNISKYLFPQGYNSVIIAIQTSSGAGNSHMHMYVEGSLVRTPTRPSTDMLKNLSGEGSRVQLNAHRVCHSRGAVCLARQSREFLQQRVNLVIQWPKKN